MNLVYTTNPLPEAALWADFFFHYHVETHFKFTVRVFGAFYVRVFFHQNTQSKGTAEYAPVHMSSVFCSSTQGQRAQRSRSGVKGFLPEIADPAVLKKKLAAALRVPGMLTATFFPNSFSFSPMLSSESINLSSPEPHGIEKTGDGRRNCHCGN